MKINTTPIERIEGNEKIEALVRSALSIRELIPESLGNSQDQTLLEKKLILALSKNPNK